MHPRVTALRWCPSQEEEPSSQEAMDCLMAHAVGVLTADSQCMKCVPADKSTIADMVDMYHEDRARFYELTKTMGRDSLSMLVAFAIVAKKHASRKAVYTEPPWTEEEEAKLRSNVLEATKGEPRKLINVVVEALGLHAKRDAKRARGD